MKHLLFLLALSPLLLYGQKSKQKLAKDSASYYRSERNKLFKSTYDSMFNSPRYQQLTERLNLKTKAANENFGVELTLYTGGQINNHPNINARLKALNVNELKPFIGNGGVGLAFRFNKVIVGYDMTVIMNGGSWGSTSTTGYYIHGYVSTNSLRTRKWIFSPQIGIGGQDITARVRTPNSSTDFNSYFTTSANQVQITNSSAALDFAIAYKLYNEKNGRYMPIFRLGYRRGLSEQMWKVLNGSPTNAPIDRVSSFYFQLLLGFGN